MPRRLASDARCAAERDQLRARVDELERVMRNEWGIVSEVRNTLHAHNRPDQPLANKDRIACRGLLEGALRRFEAILTKPGTPQSGTDD